MVGLYALEYLLLSVVCTLITLDPGFGLSSVSALSVAALFSIKALQNYDLVPP